MSYLFIFLFALCIVAVLFITLHSEFGGNPNSEQKERYSKFYNYVNGKFVNQEPTKMDVSASDYLSMMKDSISSGKDRHPAGQLPVSKINWNKVKSKEDSITWFGHSAFLLSLDNKKILVDPMLGQVALPVSFAGRKRYSEDMLHVDMVPAYHPVNLKAVNPLPLPSYISKKRGNVPQWKNAFAVMAYEGFLKTNFSSKAPKVKAPTLIIHPTQSMLLSKIKNIYKLLSGPKELVWLKRNNFEFYDRPEQVRMVADMAADTLRNTLLKPARLEKTA